MPTLFRKRLMPDECINLKDDKLIYIDTNTVITTWQTFRPKAEFSHGCSYYVIDKGYKISRFYRDDDSLAYIYCDIIDTEYDKETDTYIFTDLLADVIIENDGRVRILDLDELGDALKEGIISADLLSDSLKKLDSLLQSIYDGSFQAYLGILDKYANS